MKHMTSGPEACYREPYMKKDNVISQEVVPKIELLEIKGLYKHSDEHNLKINSLLCCFKMLS